MNKLIKSKKEKTIIILFSIISLISLSTIVYSAFSSTMHITGTAHARVEVNVRITEATGLQEPSMAGWLSDYTRNGIVVCKLDLIELLINQYQIYHTSIQVI